MKIHFRMFLLACSLTGGLQFAHAQSAEVFGGFTGGLMKPENNDQFSFQGWNASVTGYMKSRFGLTADFAGLYADVTPTAGTLSGATLATRQYSFMGGPQIRLLRTSRFETSFKALAGAVHGYLPDGVLPSGPAYSSISQNVFAAQFGSNLDFKMNRRVSLRVSPGLYLTQFGTDQTQKNLRFSIGPVFHFGGGEY